MCRDDQLHFDTVAGVRDLFGDPRPGCQRNGAPRSVPAVHDNSPITAPTSSHKPTPAAVPIRRPAGGRRSLWSADPLRDAADPRPATT